LSSSPYEPRTGRSSHASPSFPGPNVGRGIGVELDSAGRPSFTELVTPNLGDSSLETYRSSWARGPCFRNFHAQELERIRRGGGCGGAMSMFHSLLKRGTPGDQRTNLMKRLGGLLLLVLRDELCSSWRDEAEG